jgi:hypothetical protein
MYQGDKWGSMVKTSSVVDFSTEGFEVIIF